MSEDYIARLMAAKALKNGGGGSHSILILKEVIPSAVTSSNGDISLKEYFSDKKIIVLAAWLPNSMTLYGSVFMIFPWYEQDGSAVIRIIDAAYGGKYSNKTVSDITILYLEISESYTNTEDVTKVASDKSEDDIGILQTNEAEQEFPHAEE